MSQIGDTGWHALISGEIAICDEVLTRSELAIRNVPQDADSYVAMMRLMSKCYADVYESHLITKVLTPKLLTKEDVFKRSRRFIPLPDSLYEEISKDRKGFEQEWSCDLLVAGFDASNKPRLFQVAVPGRAFNLDRQDSVRLVWELVQRKVG